LRKDASPVKVAVIGEVAIVPMISRTPVPELPQSMMSAGSPKPPTPTPCTDHLPGAVLHHLCAKGPHRLRRIQHVLPFQQPRRPASRPSDSAPRISDAVR
jgi:hypothetical protein